MTAQERAVLRTVVADLLWASGCGCCADHEALRDAKARLGKALRVPMYVDKSGYNFPRYRTTT